MQCYGRRSSSQCSLYCRIEVAEIANFLASGDPNIPAIPSAIHWWPPRSSVRAFGRYGKIEQLRKRDS
jgi:hypothetical protein